MFLKTPKNNYFANIKNFMFGKKILSDNRIKLIFYFSIEFQFNQTFL